MSDADKPRPHMAVGIDLGTSNSALAFAPLGQADASGPLQVLEVAQLDALGMVGRHKTLPSSLYLPHSGELSPTDARLPWQTEGQTDYLVGRYARERGMQVPERAVASAKSWLCNASVNCNQAILPWRSTIEHGKLSPVEASARYLQHLKSAFEHYTQSLGETSPLSEQEVVLTVPASFDEVARNLTYQAARLADLGDVTLLEEPLAAFYAWIAHAGEAWRQQVQAGDLVLVCDVGGGTSDFSLVAVTEENRQLKLERISVGDHLLLGGDNMDLALAYKLKAQLESDGHCLDQWQFISLVNATRVAKETLLNDLALESVFVAVASRSSSLFAKTLSTPMPRALVEQVLLDGFFPLTQAQEMPKARRASGIQEFGLGFETDPAVSRHLARFLHRSRVNLSTNPNLHKLAEQHQQADALLMPTAVLFNGGVFQSAALRTRIMQLLEGWNAGIGLKELVGGERDTAVAYGAAYYAAMRATGQGIRIQSGTARSYYIGLEIPMPAVPGIEPPVKGLCIVPQGTDEGTELELPDQQFGLVVGEPVEFRFFSSAVRAGDQLGTTVDDAGFELDETASLSLTLDAEDAAAGEIVPVKLDAEVTELGTLRLFLKHVNTQQRWDLEFNVRPSENQYDT